MKNRFYKFNSILLIASMIVAAFPMPVLADEVQLEEISEPVSEDVLEPIEEIMVPIQEEVVDDKVDDNEVVVEEEYTKDDSIPSAEEDLDADAEVELESDTISINSVDIFADDITAFPESYREKLNKIMSNHPNWKFVRVNTNIDWDVVVTNEMQKGRSLIENSADAKYVGEKYNGSWSYATKAGVEHYLDPRLYLDESHIFAHSLLGYEEDTQKLEYVKSMCNTNDSFMKGKLPNDDRYYSDVLHSLGKKNKINPLYLVARIFQEQGYKGTSLTRGSDGYFNYYNIKGSFSSELAYAKSKGWDTAYKALSEGTEFIASGYINVGQNSLYLQKWDVVQTDPSSPYYTHQYMQNIRAPYFESAKLYNQYKATGVLNKDYTFRIPVFNNMPNSTDTGGSDKKNPPIELTSLKDLKLAESGIECKAGEKRKLTLSTVPANITPEPVFEWKSDNPDIASVDEYGLITANKAGTTTIRVSADSSDEKVGKITKSATIVVKPVTINYRNAAGEIIDGGSRNDARCGQMLSSVPYSNTEQFPVSKIEVPQGQKLAGFYTGLNRSGQKVDEYTIINGNMDIYPFFIHASNEEFDVVPIGDQYYTGAAIKPEVIVYYDGVKLNKGSDYSVTYAYNKNATLTAGGEKIPVDNMPTITIKGRGNFTGTQYVNFDIRQADISNCSAEDIVLLYKKGTKSQLGVPDVYDGTAQLKNGKDYAVTYPMLEGNKDAASPNYGAYIVEGTYPVSITGIGNYSGTKTVYEVITKRTAVKSLKVSTKKVIYDGESHLPGEFVSSIKKKKENLRIFDEAKMQYDSYDWDVRLSEIVDSTTVGTKKLIIYGNAKNGYYGSKVVKVKVVAPSKKIYFTMLPGQPGSISVNEIDSNGYIYVKGGVKIEPLVTLADGTVLERGIDYTLSYKDNNKVTDGARVIIKGKGKFAGSVEQYFKIYSSDLSFTSMSASDPKYSAKAGAFKAKFTIFDSNGKILKAGTDYDKNVQYTYVNDTQIEDISDKKNPVGVLRKAGEIIGKYDVLPAGSQVCVSVNGIKNYTGSISDTFTIKQSLINNAKVVAVAKTYNGKPITISHNDLAVYVDKTISLTKDDYDILSYSYTNNINKGKATVYIRGKGNYGGIKKVTFRIMALPILWYYNE